MSREGTVEESRGSLVIEDPLLPVPASRAKPAAVEYYAFAGNPGAVAKKLFAVPPDVVRRSCCALLLQSDTKADIHIFERPSPDDDKGPVAVWDGTSLGMLPYRIVAFLIADTARPEPHGGIRAALRAHGKYVDLGIVPCPPTARGAFGHPLKRYADESRVSAFIVAL